MNATIQPPFPNMSVSRPPLLLSLKPLYADRVFEGLKTVELRRRIASHITNRDVFVYVSSPIMELRGGFRAGDFWYGTPEEIWSKVSEFARVNKQDFDTYFEGQTVAYAFEITEVWESPNPVHLNALRNQFPNFVVPQSWRYVRNDETEFFEKIKSRTNKSLGQHCEDTQSPNLQHVPFDVPQSHMK